MNVVKSRFSPVMKATFRLPLANILTVVFDRLPEKTIKEITIWTVLKNRLPNFMRELNSCAWHEEIFADIRAIYTCLRRCSVTNRFKVEPLSSQTYPKWLVQLTLFFPARRYPVLGAYKRQNLQWFPRIPCRNPSKRAMQPFCLQ